MSKLLTFPYALSIPVIIILVTWFVCRYFFRKKKSQSGVKKSSMVTGNTVAKPINDQKVNKLKPSKVVKVKKSKPTKVEKVKKTKPIKVEKVNKPKPTKVAKASKSKHGRLSIITSPHSANDVNHFEMLVQTAFTHRRKTIHNALKGVIDTSKLNQIDINPSLRPDNLSLNDYVRISNFFSESNNEKSNKSKPKKKSQSGVKNSRIVTGNTVVKPSNDEKANKPKQSKERDLRICNFSVSVEKSESVEGALRRFKRKMEDYGLMTKLKELKEHTTKSQKRHKKKQLIKRKSRLRNWIYNSKNYNGSMKKKSKLFFRKEIKWDSQQWMESRKKVDDSIFKNFEELLEQHMQATTLEKGAVITATVVGIKPDSVMLSAGLKSDSVLPVSEFCGEPIEIGQQVEVVVEAVDNGLGETRLSRKKVVLSRDWLELQKKYVDNESVHGIIKEREKGGFRVQVGAIKGFLPASQVDVEPWYSKWDFKDKKLEFKIILMNKIRKSIVVSLLAVME